MGNAMRKPLLIAFLAAILIGGFALVGIARFGTVKASTEVNGIISEDTMWTKANSPYTLTGNVLVNNGVTLTVQAGTTVNLGSYYIMVNGTLQALGSKTDPITFNGGQIAFTQNCTDWNESTGTGCIIKNAVLSSDINVEGGLINISNNTITGAISVDGGIPQISNNTIQSQGIYLGIHSKNSTISNNIISGCSIGISTRLDHNSSSIIQGNLIINNTKGIQLGSWFTDPGHPIVQNNTIINNENGISLGSLGDQFSPIIQFNNIFDNTNYNMIVDNEFPLNTNATYNWWGTTETQAINQSIHDYYDDFNLGTVEFVPFLTELNPEAPTIPTFTITASAGTGGSISPSGSVSVSYGDDQTFTVTPNSGYQVASVLMDGVPATAPYTFFDVIADGHTISATFEPVPTPSPSPSPSPTPTPTPTPEATQISISVDAPSTDVGSAVNVNGYLLDSNGNPLEGNSVTLSYVLTDSNDWVPIGSGTTNAAGEYGIQWVNMASGTFTLKAEWNGNDEYLGASATTTLSFLPYENQQVFFVESNSTVSALTFNSTGSELSFAVSGTSGTTGYVKVTIAKSLVSNAENIKVYLDGNQLNYEVTSNPDSWLLTFTYMHSTHQVRINLASAAGDTVLGIEYWILIAVVIVIAVAGVAGFIVWREKKKP
jgi:hypothetical protein